MKAILFLVLMISASSAFATSETCYELTTVKDHWSRTPEQLCIDDDPKSDDAPYTLTLVTGFASERKTIATFQLDLLQRVRCWTCNADVYGVANPSNSVFNALKIKFQGTRNIADQAESGTVAVGTTSFFYRRAR